jgi:hypothetical protein
MTPIYIQTSWSACGRHFRTWTGESLIGSFVLRVNSQRRSRARSRLLNDPSTGRYYLRRRSPINPKGSHNDRGTSGDRSAAPAPPSVIATDVVIEVALCTIEFLSLPFDVERTKRDFEFWVAYFASSARSLRLICERERGNCLQAGCRIFAPDTGRSYQCGTD